MVLSDGSRYIDKIALSEFIDRYSRPQTGATSCWESRLMNPNWMRGQSFPHAVRAPHFLEETLTKISISSIAERMFLSLAAVALWATVVGYDDDFGSAGVSSLDIVHCFLLKPTDFWSTSWTRVHFWHAAILLWGALADFVRSLQTNRRSWRPSCNVGCRGWLIRWLCASVPFLAFLFGVIGTPICIIPLGRAIARFLRMYFRNDVTHDVYCR